MKLSSTFLALAAVPIAVVGLSGCSAIADAAHHETGSSFESVQALNKGWDKEAAWIPADSSDIRIQEASSGSAAILRATSTKELDPEACTETTRRSAPVFVQSWSPTNTFVEKVWVCGDWDVIPTDDGWFGWTPIDPDEQAAVN